jgi:acyl-CoA synthetase (AMP-forming)/AMP-acid ligase II
VIFNFNKYDSKTAVITDNGMSFTYNQINDVCERWSGYMSSRSLVLCLCNNEIGSLFAYLTCVQHGMVPIMLDGTKDFELVNQLIEVYQPNYIWLPDNRVDEFSFTTIYSEFGYALLSVNENKIELHPKLALLLTTSGSTGSPKLVRLTYDNIKSNALSIAEYLNITEEERPITSLPMYYSFGISVLNSHLISGATILLTDKSIAQKEFWSFLKENNATSLSGVPYTFEMLKRLRFFRMDLPSLKTLTQAGGKLRPELVKEYIDGAVATNKQFIVMYGQTEATARMSYLPWDVASEKFSSIGIAIPGGEFELQNENHQLITENEVDGELVYKGPNVSMGYAETCADLLKGDENNGILYTGDIARSDADGYYYITGRMKRFVKVFGNRVNLDATEQLLKSAGFDCACVGVDEKITIFVKCDGQEQSIKDLLLQKTGLNTRAFEVRIIDSFPLSSSGKILYGELSKLL